MATYIVGDIQGCYDELLALLIKAGFNQHDDQLWLTGDLVARGPKSLATLRFIKGLGKSAVTVLGNHDLHLLAIAYGVRLAKDQDQLTHVLVADDKNELLNWLKQQPLIAAHPKHPFIMVHAGISPQWTQDQAISLAKEVEFMLRSKPLWLLRHIYGDQPDYWTDDLPDIDRYRYIINSLTRMRYCFADSRLELTSKQAPDKNTNNQIYPWYQLSGQHTIGKKIVFGHWATLAGRCTHPQGIALDTGCVWGNKLTLLRWEDQAIFALAGTAYQKVATGN